MSERGARPAVFAEDDLLGFYAGARFLFVCPDCRHGSEIAATTLMKYRGGGARVSDVLASVKCGNCGREGAPAVEVADG